MIDEHHKRGQDPLGLSSHDKNVFHYTMKFLSQIALNSRLNKFLKVITEVWYTLKEIRIAARARARARVCVCVEWICLRHDSDRWRDLVNTEMDFFFHVLLTVHLSIFILVINQLMHKFLSYNKFIICLYMFRAPCAHHQEVKIVLYSIWYHHTCMWLSHAQSSLSLCTGRPAIGVMIPEAV